MYISLSKNLSVLTENMNFVDDDNYMYLSRRHKSMISIDIINNGMVSVIY